MADCEKRVLQEKIRSFNFQMAFFYLVAGLAIIVLFSTIVYTVTSDILVKEAVSQTHMAIQSGAGEIGQYIRHANSLLVIYAKNATLIDFTISAAEYKLKKVQAKMRAIRESDAHIFEVFILRHNGETIVSGQGKPMGTFENIQTNLPCFSTERAQDYGHADPWTVSIGVPILGKDNTCLGMLAMDLDYCLLMHTLSWVGHG